MIEYVNSDNLPRLELEIAKPDRTVIGRIPEAFNRKQIINLGQINEITFTIPYEIEKNFILQRNPNIDKIRSRYSIKATFDNQSEWFIVSNLKDIFSDDGKELLEVTLYSLGYQLKDKKIRQWAGVYINGEFQKESLNAQQVLDDILSVSTWGINYIDSDFLIKYRAFDFQNITVLDAVFEIAKTFGGIIKWDTENETIDLVKQENVGTNKGFRVTYGKYLKSLSNEEKSDEMITRLMVYGKDNLSINRVNPSGTDYIEDFSYFLDEFARDENKNTLSSSAYMSNDLCHAILDYQELLTTKTTEFDSLLTQNETLQSQLTTLENELTTLQTELVLIQDTIDIKQAQGLDYSIEITNEQAKQTEIASKTTEITNKQAEIDVIDTQIAQLKTDISTENNFTAGQIIEMDNFIIEDTWEDQNYYDDVELYNDAKKVLEELNKPKTIMEISIVNLFKIMESKKDWDKVRIGDKFYIYYDKFGVDVESQIIKIEIGHDDNSINLTIANTKDIERDDDILSNLIYSAKYASSSIDMNKYKWNNISNVQNDVNDLINNTRESAKREITAGVNESVVIDRRGITISDPNDINRFIKMTHGAIGLTMDGGNTYKTAILPDRIVAEVVMGKLIAGVNLSIENESGKYTMDANGFTIDGGSLTITEGSNGISLDTAQGLTVTKSNTVKSIFNATDGIKIQVKEGVSWVDKFYYDVINSRLIIDGEVNARELKVNGSSVLTTDKLKIDGQYIDEITTDQLVAGTAKITTGMIENLIVGTNVTLGANAYISWGQVTNQPFIPSTASDVGARSDTWTPTASQVGAISDTYIDGSGVFTKAVYATNVYGGDFTAFNGMTVGAEDSANKSIYMWTNGGSYSYRANISALSGLDFFPQLDFNANEIYLKASSYALAINNDGLYYKIATQRDLDNVIAKFG